MTATTQALDEAAIAAGTKLLTADEIAPRLGYHGRKGLARLRADAGAGVVPAIRQGRGYMFHWPTVINHLNRKARP